MQANMVEAAKSKNKWLSQRIQKRQNRIQNASKHSGTNNHRVKNQHIIYRRKNPVKQRKDRKKFKCQRDRKKVLKQMASDYNDFVFQNQYQNQGHVRIRPTIDYHYGHDIPSLVDNYSYNQHDYISHYRSSSKITTDSQSNTNDD